MKGKNSKKELDTINNVDDLIVNINKLFKILYKKEKVGVVSSMDVLQVNILLAQVNAEIEEIKTHPILQYLNFSLGIVSGFALFILKDIYSKTYSLNSILIFLFIVLLSGGGVILSRNFHMKDLKKLVKLKEYLVVFKDTI